MGTCVAAYGQFFMTANTAGQVRGESLRRPLTSIKPVNPRQQESQGFVPPTDYPTETVQFGARWIDWVPSMSPIRPRILGVDARWRKVLKSASC